MLPTRVVSILTSQGVMGLLSSPKSCSSSSTSCSRWSMCRFCEWTRYSITLSLSDEWWWLASATAPSANNTTITLAFHITPLDAAAGAGGRRTAVMRIVARQSSCRLKRSVAVYNSALRTRTVITAGGAASWNCRLSCLQTSGWTARWKSTDLNQNLRLDLFLERRLRQGPSILWGKFLTSF